MIVIQTKREKEKELEMIKEEEIREAGGETRVNWGQGIKIVRWNNGNYYEPERDESNLDSDEEKEKKVDEEGDKNSVKKNGGILEVTEI